MWKPVQQPAQEWTANLLREWRSGPGLRVSPLYLPGFQILEFLSRKVTQSHLYPGNQELVSIVPGGYVCRIPPTIDLVLEDLQKEEDHNVFDFVQLKVAPRAGLVEIMRSMIDVLGHGIWPPHRSLYGAVNIPSSLSGIGSCDLKASPYDTDAVSHVDDDGWFSVLTAPSSITHPHVDYYGASQYVVHFFGKKLWLLWPPSTHNLDIFAQFHEQPFTQDMTITCLRQLDGLQLLLLDTNNVAFTMPPNTIHACLSFSASAHTTKRFWSLSQADVAVRGLKWGIKWVSTKMAEGDDVGIVVDKIKDDINELKTLAADTGDHSINLGTFLLLESAIHNASKI